MAALNKAVGEMGDRCLDNLPITLTMAAAAALINLWLMWRCGRVRISEKIIHGDAGNPLMLQRMRAHANYIESTPIVLILILVIEAVRGPEMWLWIVGYLYLLVRIAHAFGMDRTEPNTLRMTGVAGTMLTLLALAVMALLTSYAAVMA